MQLGRRGLWGFFPAEKRAGPYRRFRAFGGYWDDHPT